MIAAASDFSNKGRAAVVPVTICMTSMSKPFLNSCGRSVGREAAGIGDEDIEAAQRFGAVGDPGLQRLRVGDVEGSREDLGALGFQRAGGFGHLGGVAGADGDRRALGDKALGDGKPDTAGRSCHEDFAAFQLQIHGNRSLLLPMRVSAAMN